MNLMANLSRCKLTICNKLALGTDCTALSLFIIIIIMIIINNNNNKIIIIILLVVLLFFLWLNVLSAAYDCHVMQYSILQYTCIDQLVTSQH